VDVASGFILRGRDVHVWSVRTDAGEAEVARFRLVLSPAERDRAAKFRFEGLRNAFILARGALRLLLGRYLDICPDAVQFGYGRNQKPAIAPEHRVKFNVSHSGGLAVFAFTLDREIGVDVEHIRSVPDMTAIAKRFFCPEEAADLMSFAAGEQERAFFVCWTRKEAYVKALGNGLSEPLDSFRVTINPDAPAELMHVAHDSRAAKLWTLHDLALAPGYEGALAYRDSPRPLKLFPILKPIGLLLATDRTPTQPGA
jgi:4'-phosphopantetheinyl transferase